ncbi:MAG: hypothetical protein V3S14_06370 [Anaerolineae bacterium]
MGPTREPVVTLLSCYPDLIDMQRIVVIGELVKERLDIPVTGRCIL